jgi:hypothetical protein
MRFGDVLLPWRNAAPCTTTQRTVPYRNVFFMTAAAHKKRPGGETGASVPWNCGATHEKSLGYCILSVNVIKMTGRKDVKAPLRPLPVML